MTSLRALFLALMACGAPAASTPTHVTTGGRGAVAASPDHPGRTKDDCAALLVHVEAVTVEAIDQDGMMEACLHEWDDARFQCLAGAADDDGVAACW